VRGIPCFVMVVDGREVDRVVGFTSSGRLEQMLAHASRSAVPGSLADRGGSQTPGMGAAGGDFGPASIPIPAEKSSSTFAATPPVTPPQGGHPPVAPAPSTQEDVAPNQDQNQEADFIACTVRLRIEDASGNSCGSGTIIGARGGEAWVLTCGHLFRESQGKGRIEVDLFGPYAAERIPGELVHYDLERDLGLLRIRVSRPVGVARVAPPGYQVAKGARVVTVGCNNGNPPTVRCGHVTALDKFLGPANVEVSGLPVQGRSGGGLFTVDGLVIGVCNAAVPTDNEGLYAALASIHAELEQAELPYVYRGPPEKGGRETAVAADVPSMPKKMPPPADLVQLTEAPQQPPTAVPPVSEPPGQSPALTPDERATLEEIQRRKAEGAELICIIRSRSNPQARSEVIVLDRVSPAFLKQLTAEPPHASPPAAPPAKSRGSLLDRTTDTGPTLAIPAADWRPRWLESGYQGS
jgi:S1-C subfamily serine protease